MSELSRRTAIECAEYVETNMQSALQFDDRKDLWDHALALHDNAGLIAEFGVWNGESINHFAAQCSRTVYGFDSFEGLKEDWSGWRATKGYFDLEGRLPSVAPNVELIKGWFDQTLPAFLSQHPEKFSFLHIDCDTYEATKTIFDLAGSRVKTGTVIVFDEYFGYRSWKIGEYKAWQELVRSANIEYEYLAFSREQVSVRITKA